jgi:hypothetical protein
MTFFSSRVGTLLLTSLAFGCAATTDGTGDVVGSGGGLYGTGGVILGSGGTILGTGGVIAGTGGAAATGGVLATGGVVGTGGVVSTGGAVGTGGVVSTTCSVTDGVGTFSRNSGDGRFESGTGSGYAFAYVSPYTGGPATDCGAPTNTATGICASGTVPAQASYTAVSGIAWNVNQPGGVGTTAAVYAGTVTNVGLSYKNNTTSTLRVQASTTSGDYCYTLGAGTSAALTAASFNSACWNGSGTNWNGVGLKSIQLITPSDAVNPTPFSACLNGVTLTP